MDTVIVRVIEIIKTDFRNGERSVALTVPPDYRSKIIEELKKTYIEYEFHPFEWSGIFVESKKLEDHIRYAETSFDKYERQIIQVEQKFSNEILHALRSKFPKNKFELESNREIYAGLDHDYGVKMDDLAIVVDDFEIYNKWMPTHLYGTFDDRLQKEVISRVKNGNKTLQTQHNEVVVNFLKQIFPDITFEIRLFCDVFHWLSDSDKERRKGESIILVNNFIVPTPKRFR
jgi:hypothetical protein